MPQMHACFPALPDTVLEALVTGEITAEVAFRFWLASAAVCLDGGCITGGASDAALAAALTAALPFTIADCPLLVMTSLLLQDGQWYVTPSISFGQCFAMWRPPQLKHKLLMALRSCSKTSELNGDGLVLVCVHPPSLRTLSLSNPANRARKTKPSTAVCAAGQIKWMS